MAEANVTAEELRQIIEQIESLGAEIDVLKSHLKDAFSEAKSRGFDVRVLKRLIAMRKRNREDVSEEEAILQLYMEVLGM